MDSKIKMNYFTRQWWFFDSVLCDFDNDAHFQEYFNHVDQLVDAGVPVPDDLRNPCSTHDYQVTRVLIDKESFSFVLRDPEHWVPYLLRFEKPSSVTCTDHQNGDEYISFQVMNLVGAGVGYAEYENLCGQGYRYSMIFDRDFTIAIELETEIVFRRISTDEAEDHEVPLV